MKKFVLILSITLVTISTCNSQNIEMKKNIWGYKFTQDGTHLSMAETLEKMKSNTVAFEMMKSARSNNTLTEIIGGIGGALVGFQIGSAIAGEKPNWSLAGIGAGLIVIEIPISSKVDKEIKQAIELYNSGLNTTLYKPKFEIMANGKGIGIAMNFQ